MTGRKSERLSERERERECEAHVMVILPAAKSELGERERVKARGQMGCEMILGTRQKTHNN